MKPSIIVMSGILVNSTQRITDILKSHRSLIIGGGSGIGYACAERLLCDGARVTLAGRSEQKLREAARQLAPLAEASGGAVQWVRCDVMQGSEVRNAVSVAEEDAGLDSVVTVPGGGNYCPVLGYEDEVFAQEVAMNIQPQFLAIKYAGLAMVRNGGGSIVAVSSTAAKFSSRYLSAYCTGKAGCEHLVRVAADELGAKNIRVNAVAPGLTHTAATEGLVTQPAMIQAFLDEQPLARVGQAMDQAEMIRFLAGPESTWITGQCIQVDGGHTLRKFPDSTDLARMIVGEETWEKIEHGEV